MKHILVTGGAGFIGSNFIRYLLQHLPKVNSVVNLDILTYAGNLENLRSVEKDPRYHFVRGDVRDKNLVERIFTEYDIDTVVHFAAESHVDRSITGPEIFLLQILWVLASFLRRPGKTGQRVVWAVSGLEYDIFRFLQTRYTVRWGWRGCLLS